MHEKTGGVKCDIFQPHIGDLHTYNKLNKDGKFLSIEIQEGRTSYSWEELFFEVRYDIMS